MSTALTIIGPVYDAEPCVLSVRENPAVQAILQDAQNFLDNHQMERMFGVLIRHLRNNDAVVVESNGDIINRFMAAKRIEGLSNRTLYFYGRTIENALKKINKHIKRITTDDLRLYIDEYPSERGAGKVAVNNIRRNLSSFFTWLEDENIIVKSPMRRIKSIRTGRVVKEAYTDEMLELMRKNCKTQRDLAILNLLSSSGVRLGELIGINIADIDFQNREFTVTGKGNRERIAYFDVRTKMAIQDYISTRKDTNPALFVTYSSPYDRLGMAGVGIFVRELGLKCGLLKAHPHKFRRTLATAAIDKGMPIEQVQQLLGHSKIDTTMQYAMVNQANVKNSHRKLLG